MSNGTESLTFCRYGKHVPTWTWPKSVRVVPGMWSHHDWASKKMHGWL
jgi:hypothetical protein